MNYHEACSEIGTWIRNNVPKGFRGCDFDFPHDVYVARTLKVDRLGNAKMCRGSHGWGFDEYVNVGSSSLISYINGENITHSRLNANWVVDEFEKLLVDNWHNFFKPQIEREFNNYKRLENFHA